MSRSFAGGGAGTLNALFQHSRPTCVIEDSSGGDDVGGLSERREWLGQAGVEVLQFVGKDVDLDFVTGGDVVDQASRGFEGKEVSAVNAVSIKDSGVTFGDDGVAGGLGDGQRCMLA